MAFIDENEYKDNYNDIMSPEAQVKALDYLNERRHRAGTLVGMVYKTKDPEERKSIDKLASDTFQQCYVIEEFLRELGLKVEYGWSGHRTEYIIATYTDALAEIDYYENIARDAEGDVDECYLGGDYDSEIDY